MKTDQTQNTKKMHRKEKQIMHWVKKAREQRRLNKLIADKKPSAFKQGEQIKINFNVQNLHSL